MFDHGATGETFDALDAIELGGGDEGDGDAGTTGTTGAANAMDIDFGLIGKIIIEDVRDIINVDSTGGYVCGDEDADFLITEAI